MIVGIDIGGTTTEAVRYDADWRPEARVVRATARGRDGVRDTTLAVLEELRVDTRQPDAVGIGIPGSVDAAGEVRLAVHLGLDDDPLPLGALVAATTRATVVV